MTQDRVRRLTLRDVAAELGVSAKTVSNAYVHPDQLSVELRQRIIDTAQGQLADGGYLRMSGQQHRQQCRAGVARRQDVGNAAGRAI